MPRPQQPLFQHGEVTFDAEELFVGRDRYPLTTLKEVVTTRVKKRQAARRFGVPPLAVSAVTAALLVGWPWGFVIAALLLVACGIILWVSRTYWEVKIRGPHGWIKVLKTPKKATSKTLVSTLAGAVRDA